MRALVITAPGSWSLADVADPVPQPGEVLVRVEAAGICGTDLHTFAGHNAMAQFPLIPGHEFSGTVIDVSEGVTHLALGDRVAVDPSGHCGHCRWCLAGRPNLCPDKGGYGARYPGGFAEIVAVRAAACVRLPASVSTIVGALAEPLACVIHGIDRLDLRAAESALVYGAGPVGLLVLALLRRSGVTNVAVVERTPQRRAAASEVGAAHVAQSADRLGQRWWDVVVDATGSPAAVADAVGRIERGGQLLIMGVAPQEAMVPISPFEFYRRELTLVGSMALTGTFERAVGVLADGLVDQSLVSHCFGLGDAEQALDMVRSGIGRKVVLVQHG